jgi:hypothetical protein
MSATAKALSNVASYTRRFAESFATRKHRVTDDRDQALADALQILEERSDSYYPMITDLDATIVLLDSASPLTGLVITGANFVGDAVRASGISDEDGTVTTKELTWTRVVPGDEDITVSIVSSGVANNTVTVTWDEITLILEVTRGTTATANDVFTAVNADAVGKFIVDVTKTGVTATGVPTVADITLTGGVGDLLTLSIGSTAVDGVIADCGITAVTDSAITFDFDAANETTETMVLLQLRCDGVLVTPIPLIVDFPTVTVGEGAVTSSKLAVGALSADATGRAVMATNYFDAATILLKIADGAFAADTATRALFADGIWPSAKLAETTIQYAEIAIAPADIKLLFTTPYTLVAGQAGKVVEFLGATAILDFGGVAYDTQGILQVIEETSGTVLSTDLADTLLFAVADRVSSHKPIVTDVVLTAAGGKGLKLFCKTADPAAGDGLLRYKVAYRIHTTAL